MRRLSAKGRKLAPSRGKAMIKRVKKVPTKAKISRISRTRTKATPTKRAITRTRTIKKVPSAGARGRLRIIGKVRSLRRASRFRRRDEYY